MQKILIIDDDKLILESLADIVKDANFSPLMAANGRTGLDIFKSEQPSLVLLDLKMPVLDGMSVLSELKKLNQDIPIIIITAYGDVKTAVKAIKLGAHDFLLKPPDSEKLIISMQRAIETFQLKKQVQELDSTIELSFSWLLGKTEPIKKVIEQIQQIAKNDLSVILQGETGTGKTFIANIIHNHSKRAAHTFMKIDLGAIPDTLVESELFGYEKGAFTGANQKKKGLFQLAHKGSIFLDDLENIPINIQSKLLQVVEDKTFIPIGGKNLLNTDVRIIAATNCDLKQYIKEKKFREDLYYRLNEFSITIPSLKNRADDVPFLANKFMMEANLDLDKNIQGIRENTIDILKQKQWPGNIRELKNLIRKAVLVTKNSFITPTDIQIIDEALLDKTYSSNETILNPGNIPKSSDNNPDSAIIPLHDLVSDVEKKHIRATLIKAKGNKSKTASLLKIAYTTLLRKIAEYEIDIFDPNPE